jgi:hypothetical protein
MLGWGAILGGLIGAMRGAESATPDATADAAPVPVVDGKFASLVRDTISSGQVVLFAETYTPEETVLAREVIEAAVGASRDAPAVDSPPAPQRGGPAALAGTEAVCID